MAGPLSVVTLVNDRRQYAEFRASLEGQAPGGSLEFLPVDADSSGLNAAQALNLGLERSRGEWVLLAHQDVRFPAGWYSRALSALEALPARAAVAGAVGVRSDGRYAGHVADPHGHSRWGPLPARVSSLDEHLLVLRRSSGLRFDPAAPGFHCYGTEICFAARDAGLEAWAIDAPVLHLSGGRLDSSFEAAADWLLEKRGRASGYVIPTCCQLIYRKTLGNWARRKLVERNRNRCFLPRNSACSCGFLEPPPPRP